nr:HNH endonuclease signature motif containing protein [Mycobacterium tuberculosis]
MGPDARGPLRGRRSGDAWHRHLPLAGAGARRRAPAARQRHPGLDHRRLPRTRRHAQLHAADADLHDHGAAGRVARRFSADGMGEVYAQLYATDAQALDARLNALVATVCAGDPRSTDQRRADALGALAAGADRLACRCDNPDCAAEGRPVSAVVIHVVAEQASVKGHGQAPAALLGGDGLIPAELVAELAKTAGLQPIPVPAGTEPGYRPSVKLAAFVRARDLTCRAPGCDRPATQCDLDHTIAFADGGATHAANLKCLCRLHHLLATFCGWRAQQLPDGTVIWTLPGNQTYVTTPGSALLFPALCTPTGDPPAPEPARADRRGQRTAMMPRRASTRTQNRAHCIAAERHRNHQARRIAQAAVIATETHGPPPDPDDDPPPF